MMQLDFVNMVVALSLTVLVCFVVVQANVADDDDEKEKRFSQYNDGLDNGFADKGMVDWGSLYNTNKRFGDSLGLDGNSDSSFQKWGGAGKREFGSSNGGLDGEFNYAPRYQKWSGAFGRSGRSGFGQSPSELDGGYNYLGGRLQNWRRAYYKRATRSV